MSTKILNESEVVARIAAPKNLHSCLDMRALRADLDTVLWCEPPDSGSIVDQVGNTHLYFATVNYGPFAVEVAYKMSAKQGNVRLVGSQNGDLLVLPDTGANDYGVNWNFCQAVAALPDQKEDCVCRSSVQDPEGVVDSVITQLHLLTAPF